MINSGTFNEISETGLNNLLASATENSTASEKIRIDYNDLTFGYSVASSGEYYISGAPVLDNSPSELQSGCLFH